MDFLNEYIKTADPRILKHVTNKSDAIFILKNLPRNTLLCDALAYFHNHGILNKDVTYMIREGEFVENVKLRISAYV